MGIASRIDPQDGIIYSQYDGEITLRTLQEASRRLRADPLFRAGLKELVDVGDAVPRVSADDMFQYALWLQGYPPIDFIAVVAKHDVAFGMARMFEQLSGDARPGMRVFRDEREAKAWLLAQHTTGT